MIMSWRRVAGATICVVGAAVVSLHGAGDRVDASAVPAGGGTVRPDCGRVPADGALPAGDYPVGWYGSLRSPDDLPRLAAYGGNLVLPYFTDAGLPGGTGPVTVGEFLDRAQEHGIRVILEISKSHRGQRRRSPDVQPAAIRSFVREYGDHPAVRGWYLFDEPGFDSDPSPAEVRSMYEAIKAASDLPVYGVNYGFWDESNRAYVPYTDVVGVDWYPRDLRGGRRDRGEFNWMVRVSPALWKSTRKLAERHDRKGWQAVLSGHSHEGRRAQRREGVREITLAEQRYMAATALAHGAESILWWTLMRGPDPENPWTDEATRRRISKVIRWVRRVGPYLRGGETSETDGILRRHGERDGRHVLLAVNVAGSETDRNVDPARAGAALADVRLPVPGAAGSVRVVCEGRTVGVEDGAIRDDFGRYEVRVYTWTE